MVNALLTQKRLFEALALFDRVLPAFKTYATKKWELEEAPYLFVAFCNLVVSFAAAGLVDVAERLSNLAGEFYREFQFLPSMLNHKSLHEVMRLAIRDARSQAAHPLKTAA